MNIISLGHDPVERRTKPTFKANTKALPENLLKGFSEALTSNT